MKYITYEQSKISEYERKQNNIQYIQQEIKQNKTYFEKMFENIDSNIKLDIQQQKIIVTDEKYTMVIAGAGSGKTTTITAKVDYLIKKKKIKPEEILIITFTNKAVQELKERINGEFKNNAKITTFHKLGLDIIKKYKNNTLRINSQKDKIIEELVKKELEEPSKENRKIIKYFLKNNNIIKRFRLHKKYYIDESTYDKITKFCIYIVTLVKSKNYQIEKLEDKKSSNKKIILFLKRIKEQYEKELIKNNMIDFDDMINSATKIIEKTKNLRIKYKYIIIDEYQDISESRYGLIKKISDTNNSKIIAVGDDWQSIYSFASSNINLFTNFKNKVPYCEILKIEKTYRNSQQLIDIAGKFIQKNKKQIKKNLKSNKKLDNPVKIIKYRKTINEKFCNILDYIIEKYGEKRNILVLGRYNFDKNELLKINEIEIQEEKIKYKKNEKVSITYMTVHSAKGLGYDNVILINAKKGKLGFPTNIKNNKIIDQIIEPETDIKYAEERRLFYVALTRTKNEVIILTPLKNQSCFIKEIKKYNNVVTKM